MDDEMTPTKAPEPYNGYRSPTDSHSNSKDEHIGCKLFLDTDRKHVK
jgi:hypothetical protein